MNASLLVVLMMAALASGALIWFGWDRWRLLLRWRAGWHKAQMRRSARRFLEGAIDVNVAAPRVAAHFVKWWNVDFLIGDDPPGAAGIATLTAVRHLLVPSAAAAQEPRLDTLMDRMNRILLGDAEVERLDRMIKAEVSHRQHDGHGGSRE